MRFIFPVRLVTACIIAVSCYVTPAVAASDYLLEIEGIPGESRLVPGAIDVQAYSYDIKSPRDAASGQATGKRSAAAADDTPIADISDLSFNCPLGKASSSVMLACATGKHFPKAILTCRKAGDKQETYLKVTLEDCLVSSFASSGKNSDDRASETFSLNFEKITFAFYGGGDPSEIIVRFVVKK